MIQRIQSLYLLCSVIFMALFAFNPYFLIATADAQYLISSCGLTLANAADVEAATPVVASSQNYVVAIISALIALMSIITIFLFKNRNRQIHLCKLNYVFYITLFVCMIYYIYTCYNALGGVTFATKSFVVFPICAMITNWLAQQAINKDEQMVRDSERMWTRNR